MLKDVNQLLNCVNLDQNKLKRGDQMTERVSKLIIKLKEVCRTRGLKPPEVLDIIEQHPEYGKDSFGSISLSTIRRVLRDGSEADGFKYSTIRPMVRALLSIQDDEDIMDADDYSPDRSREYFAEREALRQVVALKAAEEERLRDHISRIEAKAADDLGRQSILHDQNIDRLLKLHEGHDDCQKKSIAILEQNNSFLQQTVSRLQTELSEERESRRKLYADLKIYLEKTELLSSAVAELKKYHQ